jgi:hypothetical protein
VFAAALLSCAAALAGTITPGDLVVVRAAGGPNGDASAPLGGSGLAAAVYLDEYTTGGTFVQTFAMPQTASAVVGSQRALTLSGTQNTEGHLTLSGDGQYFIMAGYNQTANVTGSSNSVSTTVERVIGRMDFNGNIDTTTALVDAMSGQPVRAAYSTNGTDFWVTGNTGGTVTVNSVSGIKTDGVHYAQLGVNTGGTTLSTQLNTSGLTANSKYIAAVGGNLYVSSGNTSNPAALNRGVDIMSGAIASTTGQTLSSLPGFPSGTQGTPLSNPQPDDFWYANDSTIYLADNRNDGNGGIQKWTFSAGSWSLQYTLGLGQLFSVITPTTKVGVHGLTGLIDGSGNAVLYATTFAAGGEKNQFLTVTDTGVSSTLNFLATSATNTAFRGIEIAQLPPVSATPEPGSFALIVMGLLAAATRVRPRK